MNPPDYPAIDAVVGVVTLLDQQWGALESDFRRFYTADLGECCFGPDEWGVRRLYDHISTLPADSALARAMGWSWGDMEEMTATLIEVAVNSRKPADADWFHYPRPGRDVAPAPPEPPPLTIAGMRSMFLGPRR